MKTYTGKLNADTPCRDMVTNYEDMEYYAYGIGIRVPQQVHVDNEWQLFKPKPKKVWGIPEIGELFYVILQDAHGDFYAHECEKTDKSLGEKPVYLCKHTAEQVAKAENYINEFRALSDVPVDGAKQHFISKKYGTDFSEGNELKLRDALFWVVVNYGSEHELEQWLERMRIADKITTWGFHGIVTEVL